MQSVFTGICLLGMTWSNLQGKLVEPQPWYNLSRQSVQPLFQERVSSALHWTPAGARLSLLQASTCQEAAWQGGACLLLQGELQRLSPRFCGSDGCCALPGGCLAWGVPACCCKVNSHVVRVHHGLYWDGVCRCLAALQVLH